MKSCRDCDNRALRTEHVKYQLHDKEGNPTGQIETTEFTVERCKVDMVTAREHPFGPNHKGTPVLTCREMRLNGCGPGARFFIPVALVKAKRG